jgi:pyruvate kinase
MVIRRAKIVCTIGPASDPPDVLARVIEAGMDVARLNFSHGTHDEHALRIETIRRVARDCGKEVAILQDLCGPKIRCGRFPGSTLAVKTGSEVELVESDADTIAAEGIIPVQYPGIVEDLHAGDVLLLDDGRVELEIVGSNEALIAKVVQGGELRDKVGVHFPAERVRIETLTDKDKRDLSFGLSQGIDHVALSFVRNAGEVRLVRDICDAWGRPTPVVAKIETPQAIAHLESIILASDAVMVARGDLGVEFSPEHVPVMQREILGLARRHERPVIVATEMMQSMTTATRPTRAEASDVATAVFDGTDAVMLSGETATGAHPALVVRTMSRIIVEAERSAFYDPPRSEPRVDRNNIPKAVARGACRIAEQVGAKVIVAFTETGRTALYTSKARPGVPVIGMSPNDKTLRLMCLMWGVVPLRVERAVDSDAMIDRAHALLLANGIVSPGDRFITLYGAPIGVTGSTNALQVKVVE